MHFLSIDNNVTGIRLVHTCHHLDQRGLTRTVLTQKGLNLAWVHTHADVLDHVNRTKGLTDIAQLKDWIPRMQRIIGAHRGLLSIFSLKLG